MQVALCGVGLDPLGVLADIEGGDQIEDDGDSDPDPDAGVQIQAGDLLGHGGGGVERAHAEAHAHAQQHYGDAHNGVIAQGDRQHDADGAEGDKFIRGLGQADESKNQRDGGDEQDLLPAFGAGPGQLVAEGVEHAGGENNLQRACNNDNGKNQRGVFLNGLDDHRGDLENGYRIGCPRIGKGAGVHYAAARLVLIAGVGAGGDKVCQQRYDHQQQHDDDICVGHFEGPLRRGIVLLFHVFFLLLLLFG